MSPLLVKSIASGPVTTGPAKVKIQFVSVIKDKKLHASLFFSNTPQRDKVDFDRKE